jgi:hypothetical protein
MSGRDSIVSSAGGSYTRDVSIILGPAAQEKTKTQTRQKQAKGNHLFTVFSL